ncbi:MAG TPA: hypothetical protein VFS04_07810 [Alphaproteobacteria bacterium]|nr:hypothetical protein [Alphaproteobacteria bacterium]
MNNPLVDEIQALADCRSDAERADWLLTVPLSVLSHYEMTIRNRLQISGFHAGVTYLEQELRVFRRPRKAGLLAYDAAWAEAKAPVIDAAVAPYMLAAETPPVPDPTLTDL